MGCLYVVDGPGKKYIGITLSELDRRWEQHVAMSRKRRRKNYLQRAIALHGIEHFRVRQLVASDDWRYLCDLERRAIQAFGTKAPHGYNATDGGDGVIGLDDYARAEHRKKTASGTLVAWRDGSLRESRAKAFADPKTKAKRAAATSAVMRRLYATDEFRQKIAKVRAEPENRLKISAAMKRLWIDTAYREMMIERRKGRAPPSKDQRRKQSEKMKALIAARKSAGTYWLGGK